MKKIDTSKGKPLIEEESPVEKVRMKLTERFYDVTNNQIQSRRNRIKREEDVLKGYLEAIEDFEGILDRMGDIDA